MKAKDTIVVCMSGGERLEGCSVRCHLRQAEITLKAVTEELKKQVEGVKANAFSVSLLDGREHQLKMDAMISAYDVVLNLIKEETNGDN